MWGGKCVLPDLPWGLCERCPCHGGIWQHLKSAGWAYWHLSPCRSPSLWSDQRAPHQTPWTREDKISWDYTNQKQISAVANSCIVCEFPLRVLAAYCAFQVYILVATRYFSRSPPGGDIYLQDTSLLLESNPKPNFCAETSARAHTHTH